MKKYLLVMTSLLITTGMLRAQCVPDPTITAPGIYPDVLTNLPTGTAGLFYSTDIQVKVLSDTTVGALTVIVDNITIDSVSGLPAGFSYSCTPSNCVFPGGSNGCIRLSGTSIISGTYPLNVYVTLNGTLFGFPVSFPTFIPGYELVLDPVAIPVALFTVSSVTVCAGNTVTFTDQSLNNPTSWFWEFQGGTFPTSTDQNPEVLYSTPGNYDVTLTVTNSAGSSSVVQTSLMVVNALPVVSVTPYDTATVCRGTPVTFTANTGTAYTYQWYKYGNLMPGETNQSLTTTYAGKYKVKITQGTTGCSKKSGKRVIVVNQLPVSSIAAQGATTFCDGLSVDLTATTDPANTIQWTKGYTDIVGQTSTSYAATATGWYRVRVTDPNGCSKQSTGIIVDVLPAPNGGILANGPTTFCNGDSVTLSVALPDPNSTYQWEKNLVPQAGFTGYDFTAYNGGKYTYLGTGPNGCTRRSPVRKVIINCRLAGPERIDAFDATVYPNPASEKATLDISLPEKDVLEVSVFDVTGKAALSYVPTVMEAGLHSIELSTDELNPGIYMIRITYGTNLKTIRLIVN